MQKTWSYALVAVLALPLVLGGCGKESTVESAGSASPSGSPAPTINTSEPVTIRYLCSTTPSTCVDLMNKAKAIANLPNVTIEADIATNIDKNVASGWIPDIVNVTSSFFYRVIDAGLAGDMTPLIKKNNFDLSLFPQERLAAIRKYDPNGGLFAVPDKVDFPYNGYGLMYNKDIFDKFALPYPKDNMTWDQVIELSKKLTREDSGVKYTGMVIDQPIELVQQLGLNFTNNDGQLTMDDPKWKTLLETFKAAHDASGMPSSTGLDIFYKLKNVAMYVGNSIMVLRDAPTFNDSLHWDLVTFPRFSDMKEPVLPPTGGLYAITKQSKNKDIALKLLQALQSKEMQQEARATYETVVAKQKNIAALTNKKQSTYLPEKYIGVEEPIFKKELTQMFAKNQDVNSTLRELQDQIAVAVKQAKN